ncbi:hypothetical protein SAMN05216374_3209 [Tardiphaga sp. OK246]|uniref:hypothetical protein n=1 Tax=Tardiphaga sp. OK246 TaxID=1855307 RepID=UPI000B64DB6B|nr:hypothetical protein [Tardiphaga sp. OK246]SNT32867.1 hypothetical protein SAMN05216374_3209 [Tardiphaga sp. OK246]
MSVTLAHMGMTVRPALRAYIAAEQGYTHAQIAVTRLPVDVETERADAMRTARTAAMELHHLCDVAAHDQTLALADPASVRTAVQSRVLFLREPKAPVPDDFQLLRDVVEAFKHFKIDRPRATVTSADDMATIGTGWGVARYGEGKYGGIDQVMVTRKAGDKRALSSILQNVHDAWTTLLGEPLLKIGEY